MMCLLIRYTDVASCNDGIIRMKGSIFNLHVLTMKIHIHVSSKANSIIRPNA